LYEEIETALHDFYAQASLSKRGDVIIKDVTALNIGWESIIYAFDLIELTRHGGKPQRLILRMYPGEDAYQKSSREFKGMQQLHAVGYPVPAVYHLSQDNSPLGRPFIIMEYIDGEIMWPILDRATPEQANSLLSRFCELLVKLHNLDWHDFVPRQDQPIYREPYHFVDLFLGILQDMRAHFPDLGTFLPIIEWLEARRDEVPCPRPAPIHWDFHPGNLILNPSDNIKVIDWTQIQVSDPRFDLGWTLLLAGAYSGDNVRAFILQEYKRLSGSKVENLGFFDVANAVKRLGSVMISISAGAEKLGMRPDAIANMRRDFPSLRRVYSLMVQRTGIHLPEVERFLEM
jgi:aminoglycoside phosphotransferase (APT) family kinase protein